MLNIMIILLLGVNVFVLGITLLRLSHLWQRCWVAGLSLTLLLHLFVDGFSQALVSVYILTGILITLGLISSGKTPFVLKNRLVRIGWGAIWRTGAISLLAVSVVATWSFGNSRFFPLIGKESNLDFSQLGWSESFSHMNDQLAKDYAFGAWKKIDWNMLNSQFLPRITTAERAGDSRAYYFALREYIHGLPDGHIGLYGDDLGMAREAIGGGYGLNVIRLDDDRVIASVILPEGPAAQAGMLWGAEIISWNDTPVLQSLNLVPTTWFFYPIATEEGQYIQKQNLLTRGPVGKQIIVTFRNPDDEKIQQTRLTAIDDQMIPFFKAQEMGLPMKVENGAPATPKSAVESHILPNGYGYLKINYEVPLLRMLNPVGAVAQAVKMFIENDVPGVVIDMRRNRGGYDSMAPMMMSYFCAEPLFYEQVAYRDEKTNKLAVVTDLVMEPAKIIYSGPVAMLIDNYVISTGEGFPLIMQQLGRGPVLGFYGTYGSFGMSGSLIKLPGGYTVAYANGASLDKFGKIQLDSDHLLRGGVLPDLRIAITEETIKAIYVENRDILLEKAISILQSSDSTIK